jgi:hypothetical protein
VKETISSEADLTIWKDLGASAADLKKRKNVLDEFLAELSVEKPKARIRKKKIVRRPVFQKGDCLTYKLGTGNFGGAVVLDAIQAAQFGYNLIAITRINQPETPIITDFENAEVLVINFAAWKDDLCVRWIMPHKFKAVSHLFEKIGELKVD